MYVNAAQEGVSTNAGKFEILIHKKLEHIKDQIKYIQSQIDEFFIDNFYGLSGMNLVAFSCKEDDFKSPIKYQEMRSNIAKEIEKKKFNKFTLQTRSKVVLNYDNSITNQTLCPICNTRKIAINNHQCDICDAFINLGKVLTDKNTKSISAQKLHINFVGDISIDLDDKIRSYVASKDGVIKSFEELCSNDFNAIGGFKADVDGMGAFIQNSSIKDSYLNFNMFAKNIDSFFSLYIPQIIQNEFKDSYVVFAGGDDLYRKLLCLAASLYLNRIGLVDLQKHQAVGRNGHAVRAYREFCFIQLSITKKNYALRSAAKGYLNRKILTGIQIVFQCPGSRCIPCRIGGIGRITATAGKQQTHGKDHRKNQCDCLFHFIASY